MNDGANQRAGSAKIMTLAEAADFLHTSYSTVYQLVMDGELDAFRLRNAWRTSTAACEAYVSRQFAERTRRLGGGSTWARSRERAAPSSTTCTRPG